MGLVVFAPHPQQGEGCVIGCMMADSVHRWNVIITPDKAMLITGRWVL